MKKFSSLSTQINCSIASHKTTLTTILISCIILALTAFFWRGLNLGIDFNGGISALVEIPKDQDINSVRSKLESIKLEDFSLQEFGEKNIILIKMRSFTTDASVTETASLLRNSLGENIIFKRIDSVGPKVGNDLKTASFLAICAALFSILVYIWFRFDWQFGLGGIIALAHDCIFLLGFYSIFHSFEFNIASIVGILMTAGYSINSSVVIYDRILDNIKLKKAKTLEAIIDISVNETMSRTLLTSITTIIALTLLCVFGGDVIFSYCLPMLIGISAGTFSSVCFSTVSLLFFNISMSSKND